MSKPLRIAEVAELVAYAAESGLQPELVGELHRLCMRYERSNAEAREELAPEIHRKYAELVAATRPVNGRTLLETSQGSWFFWQISVLILLLTAGAVGSDILASWMADQPEPEGGWRSWVFIAQRHFLEPAAPLIWGALGASVYLGKKIYDIAQLQYFDAARLKGWWIRVILGAVLAVVVLSIFSPESLGENQLPLAASAVAFLVGLGVKVVYGALEALVEALAARMNLEALRKAPKDSAAIRNFLVAEIKNATDAEDAATAEVLSQVLAKLGGD